MVATTEDPILPSVLRPPQDGDIHPDEKRFDLDKVLSPAFTLLCLLLYGPAVIKCIRVTHDADWIHFNGHALYVLSLATPVFIVAALVWHAIRKAPSRLAICTGIFGPGGTLLVIAVFLLQEGSQMGARLSSKDCTSFSRKYRLERDWQSVLSFYQTCVSKYASTHYISGVEDCPDYQKHDNHRWRYLKQVEHRHACGGWCTAEPPLWSFGVPASTSCSTAVGENMTLNMRRIGLQVLVYVVLVVFLAGLAMVVWGHKVRKLGIEW
mmetsp:Transcript_18234/g.57351  ORF Transcript_18234/g.57351 Transcript_18234/m.57351 type:complete len:266 (-) Transcript_18234:28-825(-)|eukprot:CAMPEP_0204605936 /NCGR_PEP_ID=MMETSP0661-20131031/58791_1 /ASSEMBLY_ACC=CAM_ASM_000606 /TAXON_ID=109239 /ORGANISM="Alexandrium margalefi, Strain AMGDE01CS-322" /LENGTH=265 /DNA_ID=CAMNT_0051617221 /DNA_START=79 /DNA_END=873 /DNA_ORIENTATION=+